VGNGHWSVVRGQRAINPQLSTLSRPVPSLPAVGSIGRIAVCRGPPCRRPGQYLCGTGASVQDLQYPERRCPGSVYWPAPKSSVGGARSHPSRLSLRFCQSWGGRSGRRANWMDSAAVQPDQPATADSRVRALFQGCASAKTHRGAGITLICCGTTPPRRSQLQGLRTSSLLLSVTLAGPSEKPDLQRAAHPGAEFPDESPSLLPVLDRPEVCPRPAGFPLVSPALPVWLDDALLLPPCGLICLLCPADMIVCKQLALHL
jgi:hypothetical protein